MWVVSAQECACENNHTNHYYSLCSGKLGPFGPPVSEWDGIQISVDRSSVLSLLDM